MMNSYVPRKRQAFGNINLTKNTIAERISKLSEDWISQLKQRVGCFIGFSVAIDESPDIMDVAQLSIFIRGVHNILTVTEEFVELAPMMETTTAEDIFFVCRSCIGQSESGLVARC
ncbi:unnamed protein product [Lepeophtheirus salmonis]|uniref:(salmon louse) hypothetical protein n=1 Tax=Lepeophtheirus salmonis TaxID=72036 RepID=A0A7R8D507_LEPSM|nr:unnamed protein product [Lepeophtheirus salmonis]CAF2976040.1 unnamed protein product [Lepeophtheirus salmonis]